MTNRVGFDLATVVADSLKELLDFGQETWSIALASCICNGFAYI